MGEPLQLIKPLVNVWKDVDNNTIIETTQNWHTAAVLAYERQVAEEEQRRETERMHVRQLGLQFSSLLLEIAHIDLGVFVPEGAGPHSIDGHRWTMLLDPSQDDLGHLYLGVKCAFCERDTDQRVESHEDLGRLLRRPSGYCIHCLKNFGAPPEEEA